eukprot:1142985-Pelagomonas_calceolata.AAC.1
MVPIALPVPRFALCAQCPVSKPWVVALGFLIKKRLVTEYMHAGGPGGEGEACGRLLRSGVQMCQERCVTLKLRPESPWFCRFSAFAYAIRIFGLMSWLMSQEGREGLHSCPCLQGQLTEAKIHVPDTVFRTCTGQGWVCNRQGTVSGARTSVERLLGCPSNRTEPVQQDSIQYCMVTPSGVLTSKPEGPEAQTG